MILNPLRDKNCVVMLHSIEIESLRDIDIVVMLSSIEIESLWDILFPFRGININRIRGIIHFQIILAEDLILIRTRKRFGIEEKIRSFDKA